MANLIKKQKKGLIKSMELNLMKTFKLKKIKIVIQISNKKFKLGE